jgi:3-hydroxyacyl-CoA dehydrogenase
VNSIASMTKRPQDVVGMHFFSPANIMKLCEIVRGEKTSPEVLATAASLVKRIGKVPVVVGVCHGFVGNRMLMVRILQARKMLLEGALPQQIDAVAAKFGMMGPFAMSDLAGLDIGWRSRRDSGEKSPIEDALCEAGRFGQKTGAGYYRYERGSRTPIPDPDVDVLIVDTSRRLDISRRQISDEEIHQRLIYPMINEGARILDEGIAERSSDIDLVWLYGYGWPAQTGGPMFLADQVGLAVIAERLAYMAALDNDGTLRPTPLLERLAMAGSTFASLK